MTDSVLIGLAIAGGIITVVSALIGLGYKMGALSRRTDENTEDIREIKGTYVVGLKDVNEKLDALLKAINGVCERVSNLEGRMK